MILGTKISDDLKNAMKSGDREKVGVLRLLQSVLHNKAIAKGKDAELTEEETLAAVLGEAKKRQESIKLFEQGGRQDLAEKESKELAIIRQYLPEQMSREETAKAVEEILAKNPAGNFGEAMKAVMKELRGKADSAVISEIIKSKFGGQ